jgi:hypothetical protein
MCVLILRYTCPHTTSTFGDQRGNTIVRPPLKFQGILVCMYASHVPIYVYMYVCIHIYMYVGGHGQSDVKDCLEIQRHPYMYVLCMYVCVCMYTYVCVFGGGIGKSDVRPLLKFKQARSLVCRAVGRHQIAPCGAPKVT